MLTVAEISRRLAERAEDVAQMLLPGGKKQGNEWLAGDVNGSEGKSLHVTLGGDHAGHWRDFANPDDRGDLLDAWRITRGLTASEAIKQSKEFLGIQDPHVNQRSERQWAKPSQNGNKPLDPNGPALEYLTKVRKLEPAIINRFRIEGDPERRAIVFPSFSPDGKLVNRSYRTLTDPKKCWQDQGCAPALFGWQALSEQAYRDKTVLLTEGQCLSGDTEVLTPAGWVRLDEWNGQKVTQWENGQASAVEPIAYIRKSYSGELVRFTSKTGLIDLLATPDHRVLVFEERASEDRVRSASDIRKGDSRFYRSAFLNSPGIEGYTNSELQLFVAIQADASLENGECKSDTDGWRIELKKERKITRLRMLLHSCEIPFKEDYENKRGAVLFRFRAVRGKFAKVFPNTWYVASSGQRSVLACEFPLWDGSGYTRSRKSYFTTKKENANFVQWCVSMTGGYAKLASRDREGKRNRQYRVEWATQRTRGDDLMTNARSISIERIPFSGEVFCVQVPSSFIVTRRNGAICVTGNCDAMTWTQWGIPALSIPNGSGTTWIDYEFDNLSAFDTIYIAFDSDPTGSDITEKVINRLGRHRCLVVGLPFKDANEGLQRGATAQESGNWIKDAKAPPVKGLITAENLESRILRDLEAKPTEAWTLPFFRGEDDCSGFYPQIGDVTLWSGYRGDGKTAMLSYWMMSLLAQNQTVFVASLEMKAERIAKRMITAGLGRLPTKQDVSTFIRECGPYLVFCDKIGFIGQEELLEMMRYSYQRYGAQHFFIDSLMRISKLEENYPEQTEFMNHLCEFSKSTATNVHLVAHPRKPPAGVSGGDKSVKGNSSIENSVDNVAFVIRNRNKDDMASYDTEIKVTKQRELGFEGSFFLKFDQRYYAYSAL